MELIYNPMVPFARTIYHVIYYIYHMEMELIYYDSYILNRTILQEYYITTCTYFFGSLSRTFARSMELLRSMVPSLKLRRSSGSRIKIGKSIGKWWFNVILWDLPSGKLLHSELENHHV